MLTFFWHLELPVAFFETYFPIRDLGVGLKDENMMMKKMMRQNLLMRGGLPYPSYHLYFRNSSSIYIYILRIWTMKLQMRNVRKFIAKLVGIISKKSGGQFI